MRKRQRGKNNASWMTSQRLVALQRPDEDLSTLARRLGLDPRTVQAYYRGDSGASVESVEAAVRVGGVSAHWLVTGEGPRYREVEEGTPTGKAHRRVMAAIEKAQGILDDLSHAAGLKAPEQAEEGEAEREP